MLDDPELRALFQAEAEEHLQHLDEALLRLEAEPGDQDTLDSAFRDAHSLKGAAGMMGLDDVQQVAHRFEDVLGAARMGIMALRPPVVDALYRQLDAIRALVNQAVTGAPAGVDVAQVLTLLSELERGALPAALPQLPIAPELSPPPPEPPRLPASPEGDSAESDLALEGVRSEPEPAPDPAPVGMLADPDLRALFQAEAEEHLQHLDQALLRLEAAPGDPEIVAGAFRDAHSLKGAAGMVGVDDVQQVAHRFEDVLGAARKGTLVLQPHVVDALYRQLDAMRALVKQAVTGVPAGVDVPQVLALLADLGSAALPPAPSDRAPVASAEVGSRGSLPAASAPPESTGRPTAADRTTPPPEPASSTGDPPGIVVSQASPDAVAGPRAPAPALPPASPDPGRYQITTVRVETERLDELMRQAGELNVTRVRILRRLADVDESLRHWEECVREVYLLRRHLLDLERAPTGAITPLAGANERLREKLEELGAGYRRLAEWMHEDSSRLHFVTEELEESIRSVRLLPLSNVFNLFPRVVRDLGREQGKQVQLVTEGGDTAADKRILEEIKDPLMHLIRNAVDHGIETPEERQRAGKPRQATIQL
ncbi:MAG: hypothetical protein FJX77_02070, partial [Armatimonadetes bacterium]|nr:hypothetical protein [Armatimonadota bacterium]